MMLQRRFFMIFGTCCWSLAAFVSPVQAQAPIFPQPFSVEHQIVQTDAQGAKTVIGPVKDYYGASWIVSVHSDDSRTIVDFSRNQLTIVDDRRGQYAALSFDRLGELKRRLDLAESGPQEKANDNDDRNLLEIGVSDPLSSTAKGLPTGGDPLAIERPGVRRIHVQASRQGKALAGLDLWMDPEIRLSPQALDAIERFERSMLGRTSSDTEPGFQDLLTEGRHRSGGGLVLGSSHSLVFGEAPEIAGTLSDVPLKIEILDTFPTKLLEISEHFVRVPHPLETIVAHAEREADLRRRMSGER